MEAIGQLTGGVAHDFNNLLTAVLGSLDSCSGASATIPGSRRWWPTPCRPPSGAPTSPSACWPSPAGRTSIPMAVAIPALVNDMTDLLDRSLGANISIAVRFPPAMGSVLVDRNQLEMAVLNLAVNARDAMPRGGAITIEAREQELAAANAFALPAGRYAVLSITDHGEGMDETTLLRATEPFFTTKGVGKGTGLGLSMVHGLAEQSGGRFVLKSKPGEGTTASLWLPVVTGGGRAAPTGTP